MNKPHLSASQIKSYLRCPESYRRNRESRAPPTLAIIAGSGVHRAAAENGMQKIESHNDLEASDVIDLAVAAFDEQIGSDFWRLEPGEPKSTAPGKARDRTAMMAGAWRKLAAPAYQPVFVEAKIDIPGATRDLVGYVDLIDDRGRVVDWKTAGRSKRQTEADAEIGLTVYAAGFAAMTGNLPSSVILDVVINKRNPERQTLVSTRGPADFAALVETVNVVAAGIDAGYYPPAITATTGAWPCSTCFYRGDCKYLNGRKLFDLGS
jgi:hypothetical protein